MEAAGTSKICVPISVSEPRSLESFGLLACSQSRRTAGMRGVGKMEIKRMRHRQHHPSHRALTVQPRTWINSSIYSGHFKISWEGTWAAVDRNMRVVMVLGSCSPAARDAVGVGKYDQERTQLFADGLEATFQDMIPRNGPCSIAA